MSSARKVIRLITSVSIVAGLLALCSARRVAKSEAMDQLAYATAVASSAPFRQSILEPLGEWQSVMMPSQSTYVTADFSSEGDGWALGYDKITHWDGHAWTDYSVPKGLGIVFTGIKMLSPDDGWAVGEHGTVAHWNGRQWTEKSVPTNDSDDLFGVAFASTKLGWAVGAAMTDPRNPSTLHGLVLQWNGSVWSRSDTLAKDPLLAIDVPSATEGWMVGSGSQFFHWDRGLWRPYENRASPPVIFNAIAVNATNDAWLVGDIPQTNEGEIWHWNGSQWSEFLHTRLGLFSVSMASPNFGWAVGGNTRGKRMDDGHLLLHWNGQEWKEYPISTTVPLEFVWAPNATDGWVFGGGPTLRIDGEYPGVAFRYRIPAVTSTPTVTASHTPLPTSTTTRIPPATQTPVASPTLQPSSAPPIATSKPSLSPPAREPTPNLPPWIVLAALFILVAGGIMVLTYRHRRG